MLPQYMEQREHGLGYRSPGLCDRLHSVLYHSFAHSYQKLPFDRRTFVYTDYSRKTLPDRSNVGPTNGIFNMEFSPDGSLLGVACEGKNILLFDSSTRQLVNCVDKAHDDCVNCIRFLDTRLFATCSDDKNVALWDTRYLRRRLRTLSGHSNWVKNIEFSYRENLLVTSGFDGAICAWDINRYLEAEASPCSKVFYTNGLMRMKLTPDGSKMVISTMNSYIMIIHDLCLESMSSDLQNFKPNMYRLMQMSRKALPMAVNFTQLFHAKRNRVEFIEDFAPTNDADIIASLQIHPQGWVAASRNGSSDEQSEWCCVHDIQSYPTSQDDDLTFDDVSSEPGQPHRSNSNSGFARLAEVWQSTSTGSNYRIRTYNEEDEEAAAAAAAGDDGNRAGHSSNLLDIIHIINSYSQRRRSQQPQPQPQPPPFDENGEPVAGPSRQSHQLAAAVEDDDDEEEDEEAESGPDINRINQGFLLLSPNFTVLTVTPSVSGRSRGGAEVLKNAEWPGVPKGAKLHQNSRRLTHYIEESNQGRGFIKEISFSPDGRVLASPYAHGIRLLAFDPHCRDLSECSPKSRTDPPRTLHEVCIMAKCHNDTVLASAFSPHDFSLVSGCMEGKIVWHQPVL